MSVLWILGSADAEMSAIESLLRECGQRVYIALAPTMRLDPTTGTMSPVLDEQGLPVYGRVAPGQVATGATELLSDGSEGAVLRHPSDIPGLVAIEVAGPWGQAHIDHHGHAERAEWGPDRFLQASSLGQVIERLAQMDALPASWPLAFIDGEPIPVGTIQWSGSEWCVRVGAGSAPVVIPQDLVFTAAADHCLAAAAAGACLAVDSAEFRAAIIAGTPVRGADAALSTSARIAAVERSIRTLRDAPAACDLCAVTEIAGPGSARQRDAWQDDSTGSPRFFECAGEVRDLSGLTVNGDIAAGQDGLSGEQFPHSFQFGPIAASLAGVGYVVIGRRWWRPTRDAEWIPGDYILRVGGCGLGTVPGAAPIDRWMAGAGEARGCYPASEPAPRNLYGVPARGFGGGTLRPSSRLGG